MFNNAAGRIIGALLLALTTLAPLVLRTVSDAGDHVPPVFTNGSEGGFDTRRDSLCDTPLNVSVATSPHGPQSSFRLAAKAGTPRHSWCRCLLCTSYAAVLTECALRLNGAVFKNLSSSGQVWFSIVNLIYSSFPLPNLPVGYSGLHKQTRTPRLF